MPKVKFKSHIFWGRVSEDRIFKMPKRSTDHAVAHDLYLPDRVYIYPGQTVQVPLNINCCMPSNFCAKIYVRSSVGTKYNITLANGTGVIDADYYDEWSLFLYTPQCDIEKHDDPQARLDDSLCWVFQPGERIAQVCFEEVPEYVVSGQVHTAEQIKELVLSRGSNRRGGFGSTGK